MFNHLFILDVRLVSQTICNEIQRCPALVVYGPRYSQIFVCLLIVLPITTALLRLSWVVASQIACIIRALILLVNRYVAVLLLARFTYFSRWQLSASQLASCTTATLMLAARFSITFRLWSGSDRVGGFCIPSPSFCKTSLLVCTCRSSIHSRAR